MKKLITILILLFASVAWAAYEREDFDDPVWVETDLTGVIAIDGNKITATNFDRNIDGYVTRNMGAGFITDFVHTVDVNVTAMVNDGNSSLWAWAISNANDDINDIAGDSGDAISVIASHATSTNYKVQLYSLDSGTPAIVDSSAHISVGTKTYWAISRTGTTGTVEIYSTASLRITGGAGDIDTIGGTVVGTAFRYVYGIASRNNGLAGKDISGTVENLYLQGPGLSGVTLMGVAVNPLRYDLKALWTAANQTFTNAQVLDTVAEGVQDGSLTVVDTSTGTVKVVSNELELVGDGSWDTTGVYITNSTSRRLGKGLFAVVNKGATNTFAPALLWLNNAGIDASNDGEATIYFRNTADIQAGTGVDFAQRAEVGSYSASTEYSLLILIGGYDSNGIPFKTGDTVGDFLYGASMMIRGGAFSGWTLLWKVLTLNTTSLFGALVQNSGTDLLDNILILTEVLNVDTMFQPNFLDTFVGTNDDQLVSNHTPEVVAGATGTGNPWESGSTTWTIQTNAASNDPSLGAEQATGNLTAGIWYVITATEVDTFFTGCAIGDYFLAFATTGLDANNKVQALTTSEIHASDDMGISEGIFDANLIVAADNPQAGLVIASDSAANPQNYVVAYYDQVDAHVKVAKVVAGSPTSLIDVAAAYSASAQLRVIAYESGSNLKVRVYYNGTVIGTEQTISDVGIVSNTRHGIMSVDSSNSVDNFTVMKRTDANWDTEISRSTEGIY